MLPTSGTDPTMKLFLLLVASLASASALLVSPTTRAAVAAARVAASPAMACNGGKGGRGGKSPPKDKARRGKLRKLLYAVRARAALVAIRIPTQSPPPPPPPPPARWHTSLSILREQNAHTLIFFLSCAN